MVLASAMKRQRPHLKSLIIMKLEVTRTPIIREIIEMPALLYNLRDRKVYASFHEYVKPSRIRAIDQKCAQVTGVRQDMVENADLFPPVWKRFKEFLQYHDVLRDPSTTAFLTYDKADLNEILPAQLAYKSLVDSHLDDLSLLSQISRLNIKKAFARQYKLKQTKPLRKMMGQLALSKDERYHFGMEECWSLARLVEAMQHDGWRPRTPDLSKTQMKVPKSKPIVSPE
ncbi:3'-5' exoribonuclease 1 [Psilocybe cubensis]|uniref:3'-5' exoribonuclease 1 n=2 Tax=Psilocybe cubensis TaxID=181762 RepID=A0ACB8GR13_PSICU|nr:3'-5' exoribonuclease 1 [Psilocybe cubensis]KAH9478101.1 3'-5' exoribonuclease 1 [Psilocybe cubensis]